MPKLTRRQVLVAGAAAAVLPLTSACQLRTPFNFRRADVLPPLPEGAFTIVIIPDTQKYRGKATKAEPESLNPVTNEIFESQTRWIADNIDAQRIAFVSHVGDIVDKNVHDQWIVARRCMDLIHGRVPYGISIGNHDMTSAGDASLFQQYFPADRFRSFDWYGGDHENNTASFQLFSAAGLDFIFVHLPCNAPDPMLDWANAVLAGHRDRMALITTHMHLGPIEKPRTHEQFLHFPKGRMLWTKIYKAAGNHAQQMWDKCYSRHPNLLAVCSGDQSRTQAFRMSGVGAGGRVVHEMISDYGSGELRLLRVLPHRQRIDVVTWNTHTATLCRSTEWVPAPDAHQFTLPVALSAKITA